MFQARLMKMLLHVDLPLPQLIQNNLALLLEVFLPRNLKNKSNPAPELFH